jgi:small-conductance mechanosensitive channel
VLTGSNMELIVPNAIFLEQEITNWTLSDARVRIQVDVGVAYGSPTERVRELLLQAAHEHPKVRTEPQPFVLFSSFGDNALGFASSRWTWPRSRSRSP